MPRLFVGIPIRPSEALRGLLRRLEPLGPLLSVTPADRLHLTLRFIGDRDEAEVGGIGRAVAAAADRQGWFNLALEGIGRFPPTPRRLPRIVYAAVADPAPLVALAGSIDRELAACALPIAPDPKPWTAHVTLARHRHRKRPTSKQRRKLEALLAEHRQTPLGRTPVRAVELVESTLTPGGPVHTPRAVCGLAEAEPR